MAEEAASRALGLTTFMSFRRPLLLLMANAWIEVDVLVDLSLGLCVVKFSICQLALSGWKVFFG